MIESPLCVITKFAINEIWALNPSHSHTAAQFVIKSSKLWFFGWFLETPFHTAIISSHRSSSVVCQKSLVFRGKQHFFVNRVITLRFVTHVVVIYHLMGEEDIALNSSFHC